MNTQYVIVIEADNKRALAAYLKGLADLDLIWPDLMAAAKAKDDAEEELDRQATAQREKNAKERKEELERYEREYKEWSEWKARSFFHNRPPKPVYPLEFTHGIDLNERSYPSFNIFGEVHRIQRIRDELRRMADVASVALGPYRMTEHQVSDMIEWESGASVFRLKEQMGVK